MSQSKYLRDMETLSSAVRSFKGENFTNEHLKSALANFPPVRRIPIHLASRLLERYNLAEPIGTRCVQCGAAYRSTREWRPLI